MAIQLASQPHIPPPVQQALCANAAASKPVKTNAPTVADAPAPEDAAQREEPNAQRKEPNSEREITMVLAAMERKDAMLERVLNVSQPIEPHRLTCNVCDQVHADAQQKKDEMTQQNFNVSQPIELHRLT